MQIISTLVTLNLNVELKTSCIVPLSSIPLILDLGAFRSTIGIGHNILVVLSSIWNDLCDLLFSNLL